MRRPHTDTAARRLGSVLRKPASIVATLVVALFAAPAVAHSATYPACIAQVDTLHAGLVDPSASVTQHISFTAATGITYQGDVFRPKSGPGSAAGNGFAPTAAIMHGKGANPCSIWWLARLLAGKGWIVVDVYRPPSSNQSPTLQTQKHIDALKASVRYLRSPGFPYAGNVDAKRLVLIGHSLGAGAASVLQGEIPGVKAVVALDNLHKWDIADPGTYINCVGKHHTVTNPRVPALGFASDTTCTAPTAPAITPETKLTGYGWWRHRHMPVVELVMRGFSHGDFTSAATDEKLERVTHFVLPWLGDALQTAPTFADILNPTATVQFSQPATQPIKSWLSLFFHSAAYVPGNHCMDLLSCL
jgi:dienelactone hydrolase